eukprot:jgi/Hompol1/1676/HPOL_004882-RA
MSLFNAALVPPSVQAALKPGLVVRPLEPADYEKGYLQVLGQLTTVGTISKAEFAARFAELKQRNDTYFSIVIEDTKLAKIIAAGTILVERKFIHGCGNVGHIEDIVTHKDYRGHNLGFLIIETLKGIGRATGCYKIIREKCGFSQKEVEMVIYIPENEKAKL